MFLSLQSELWTVLRLIPVIPPAVKCLMLPALFMLKTWVLHRELCVCSLWSSVMSEGTVRQTKKKQTKSGVKWWNVVEWRNVHDEKRSVQLTVVSEDLVQNIGQKICERHRQFQNCHVNFHNFHALCCMRVSQLGLTVTSFMQDKFWKWLLMCTACREWFWLCSENGY
jgi:hypothetical protein